MRVKSYDRKCEGMRGALLRETEERQRKSTSRASTNRKEKRGGEGAREKWRRRWDGENEDTLKDTQVS